MEPRRLAAAIVIISYLIGLDSAPKPSLVSPVRHKPTSADRPPRELNLEEGAEAPRCDPRNGCCAGARTVVCGHEMSTTAIHVRGDTSGACNQVGSEPHGCLFVQ